MVIDTVADVVLGDVGKEIMNTAGVAVRPFWWSTECLQVLGLATGDSGAEEEGEESSSTTVADGAGSQGEADGTGTGASESGGSEAVDSQGSGSGETGDGGEEGGQSVEGEDVSAQATSLTAGWIALIVILGVVAVAALAALAVLLSRSRRGPEPPANGDIGGAAPVGAAPDVQVASPAVVAAPVVAAAPAAPAAFCSQCGRSLEADAKFCPGCGRQL